MRRVLLVTAILLILLGALGGLGMLVELGKEGASRRGALIGFGIFLGMPWAGATGLILLARR